MTRRSAGVKLICPAHGSMEWQDPTLRPLPGGYGLGADCALGGRAMVHWLAPDPARPGRYAFTSEPHAFASAGAAFDTLEIYRRQE